MARPKNASAAMVDETKQSAAERTAPASAASPKGAPELPKLIRLAAPHGFIDEAGEHKYWREKTDIVDPAHIALLIARGAHLEV